MTAHVVTVLFWGNLRQTLILDCLASFLASSNSADFSKTLG